MGIQLLSLTNFII